MVRVGYLGPKGTYTEKAAEQYCPKNNGELIPMKSLPEIFWAVRDGQINHGIVPIENSIEGSVNQTLDLLIQAQDIVIQGEIILPVQHALLAKAGTGFKDIKKVFSHGQALAQCSRFLEERLPWAEAVEALSTAKAADLVASSNEPIAAIGHPEMAEIYKLVILETGIANCGRNQTRFIVIGLKEAQVEYPAKTSILISLTDRPGGLYQVLKEFALRNINLTKIESRPAKNGLGNYLFFIDFAGQPREELVADGLKNVQEICACFRVLGAYKAAESQINDNHRGSLSLNQIREDIDIIDRQIVELLAKRTELVNFVGEIKGSLQQIRDENREKQILAKLTAEAKNRGVSPGLITRLYGILFDHFVDLQESKRR